MNDRRPQPAGLSSAPDAMALALLDVTQEILGAPTLVEAAQRVAALGVRHLGADLAGVSCRQRRAGPVRLAATDPALPGLGELDQHDSPLFEALEHHRTLTVADTRAETRWPRWSEEATGRGLRSALFVGLPPLPGRPVVLELYARSADAFAADVRPLLLTVAHQAGLALRHADRVASLEEALHTRGLIGQAQGLVMERFRLDGDEAMTYLRRRSQEAHVRVRDLAATLVARHEDETARPGGHA